MNVQKVFNIHLGTPWFISLLSHSAYSNFKMCLSFLHKAIKQYCRKGEITMADMRIYCTDDYKKKIKIMAVKNGMTVSDMLLKIVNEVISGANDSESLQSELESINTVLSKNGGKMTADERQKLKDRRNEIKKILQRGEL